MIKQRVPTLFALAGLTIAASLTFGLAVAPSSLVTAQDASEDDPLPPVSREQIEWVIENYLFENPEVIERALSVLEDRRAAEAARVVQDTLENNADVVYNDPMDPTLGNPEGTVDMVHFFDYQCGFCKSMANDLAMTLTPDGRVRAKFKEFPILGPASVVAARAALAADKQGEYWAMHQALMGNRGRLSEVRIFAIAQTLGLDVTRLREDMQDPAIDKQLEKNSQLAERLGIQGTPGFVIGRQVYATSLSPENLRRALDAAEEDQRPSLNSASEDSRG